MNKCFLIHYFLYKSFLKLHSVPINTFWKVHLAQRRGKQRQRKVETQRNQEKETTRRAERVKVKTELEREIDKETKKQRTECVYQRQPRRDSQTVRSHTHTYEHGGNRPRGKM